MSNSIEQILNKSKDDLLIVTSSIKNFKQPVKKTETVTYSDISIDTSDLIDSNLEIQKLKNYYSNNMITWSFLKKLSEFNQWPFGCIGNFIENSIKDTVDSKNININVQYYNSEPTISIKDDGNGINSKEFNQILYSFSINSKKEYNFFKYGVSMKSSALRLGDKFLLISKTNKEFNIGLISKSLQNKLDTEFLIAPVINYSIIQKVKYIARSTYAKQSLSLILEDFNFIFNDEYELFKYIDSFDTGTHIFISDLVKITSNEYELYFDHVNNDIIYNYFNLQIGFSNFIDSSLVSYLKYFNIKPIQLNVFIMNKKVNTINPLFNIFNSSKNEGNIIKLDNSLKVNNENTSNAAIIDGNKYKGIIFNKKYYDYIISQQNFITDNYENENLFNGILLYSKNRLICRYNQQKFGDICYFIKKLIKYDDIDRLFPLSGYIELSTSLQISTNKTVNNIY
jgi:hypothetical protein